MKLFKLNGMFSWFIASNMSELLDRTHLTEADGGEATGSAPQPASNWSRSYQNPVGKIYYPPTGS